MKSQFKGMLEIDHDRGVIYFHLDDPEVALQYGTLTPLRIQGLEIKPFRPIDLNVSIIHVERTK